MVKFNYKVLPALLWMGIIFYLSSVHNLKISGNFAFLDFTLRKLAHISEYLILLFLWHWGLGKQNFTWAYLFTVAFAITDELHQHFVPTRDGKTIDIIIDTTLPTVIYLTNRLKKE